ncbi:MAG: N-acetyl-gamma-glutamyl-phosphate reductase [Halothermotrichaceae bacterium]
MIKASIIGATGYVGVELLRLLNNHKRVKIDSLVSRSSAGKRVSDIYPQFKGNIDYQLKSFNINELKKSDIVFTALPHGVSQDIVAQLHHEGIKIIDMSGDYRYQDKNIYEKWYKIDHNHSQLLKKAVYGLAELNREKIKNAEIIANPGCYPTASLLALIPAVKANLVDKDFIIVDAKSGVSGAGKSLKEHLLFNEVDENIKAYSINNHRHTSEIENILQVVSSKENIKISFTPHLIPMKRGILSTVYMKLLNNVTEDELINIYKNTYDKTGFVKILTKTVPQTKYVYGTNYCHLGVKLDQRTNRLVVISAIDNVGKGAAGQAVQNMNIIFDFPEDMGIKTTAVIP